ncbi:hypothetical protein [uncultured Methanobrevibacter sp.]|uniref:hypothetical protein n=1 Tax=uncultured Methanobrevibacter sp. TaxID=253161 RepID=UPI0025DA2F19|nr:hypothetical protein [uncultured Methanobrevibacter sp.]
METFRFGGGMEFLPTLEEEKEELLDIWEHGTPIQRKQFEKDLEMEEPELFAYFKRDILLNHPEYKP